MYLPTCRLSVACLLVLVACGTCRRGQGTQAQDKPPVEYEYRRLLMGVQVRVRLYAPDEETAEKAALAVFKRVNELEDIASDWRLTSELTRLCAKAGTGPVKVSDDLFLLLQKSYEVADATDGAFDPTVGPLVRLWREARKEGRPPNPGRLAAARRLVGYRMLKLDAPNRTVELQKPGMLLDLGGIAKGYAGDAAIKALRENGVTRALFEAGGEIVLADAPPGKDGWNIQIIGTRSSPKPTYVTLRNCAVSTSGDTEQYVILDGQRYSHVVDPRTGMALTNRILTTVIAPEGILTDILSTAAGVLGPQESEKLAKKYPQARMMVRLAPD